MIARRTLLAVLVSAALALNGCTALSKIGQVVLDPSVPVGAPDKQPSRFSLSLYARPTLNLNPSSTLASELALDDPRGARIAVNVSADNPVALTDKLQALLDELRQEHPARSVVEFDQPPAPAMSAVSDVGSYQDASVHMTYTGALPKAQQVTTPIAFQMLQLKDDSMLLTATYEALADNLDHALGSTLLQVDDYRLMPGQFKFIGLEQVQDGTRYLAVIAHYHQRNDIPWKRVLPIAPRGHHHAVLVQFEEDGVVIRGEGG